VRPPSVPTATLRGVIWDAHFGVADDRWMRRLRASDTTYHHVGSTLGPGSDADGVRHEDRLRVGTGPAALAAARTALRSWRPQRSLGATVAPAGVAPDLGETVALGFGVGWARYLVPTRIVAVVDEPERYGFAYGTLPGHPERGEELFLAEMAANGDVVVTIRVDATPAPALRPIGFVVRPLQRAAVRRYLRAVARHVGSS
jgi:uncharacterized protein (UPF0548 family)